MKTEEEIKLELMDICIQFIGDRTIRANLFFQSNLLLDKAFSLGLEEGKKFAKTTYSQTCEKLGRKVVYNIAYNQACEDIIFLINLNKDEMYYTFQSLIFDIRKLQEEKQ